MANITLEALSAKAERACLTIAASVNHGHETILLLAPHEPGFWQMFQRSREFCDGRSNPMDRWSNRVISELADQVGATAIFPSDGPPYAPFFAWAVTSKSCWKSPVSLLVHEEQGLWVSFRGAIALPFQLSDATSQPSPCAACAQPCLTACPVDALNGDGYDVASCKQHLLSEDRAQCMSKGCAIRRVCPAGQNYERSDAQSAYHMAEFCPAPLNK